VRKRPVAVLLAAAALLGVAGCGDDDGGAELVVSGASSLTAAFEDYGRAFGDVRFSFAGSDDLAAQIRQGVAPDVFAAANSALPQALHEEGLLEQPVVFATNELVLAVPRDADAVTGLDDLARPGVTLAIGSEDVPIGSYTREVLERLGGAEADAILANVRSHEPDVKGIVGKLAQGAVDAGFVYATDVQAAGGKLRGIALPPRLRPAVAYGVAVAADAEHPAAARRFVDGLLEGDGARALRAAGFGSPPR
jgi:molybdate transport system substrate-binding protein